MKILLGKKLTCYEERLPVQSAITKTAIIMNCYYESVNMRLQFAAKTVMNMNDDVKLYDVN